MSLKYIGYIWEVSPSKTFSKPKNIVCLLNPVFDDVKIVKGNRNEQQMLALTEVPLVIQ